VPPASTYTLLDDARRRLLVDRRHLTAPQLAWFKAGSALNALN